MTNVFNIEPPKGLLEKIIKRIHREERILAIKKMALFSITFVISVVAIVPSFNMLLSDFASTGFLNFFYLMFSDFSIIMAYWQNFGMILLETLPAISLAIFLAVLLTLFQSILFLTKNVKHIISNNRFAIN